MFTGGLIFFQPVSKKGSSSEESSEDEDSSEEEEEKPVKTPMKKVIGTFSEVPILANKCIHSLNRQYDANVVTVG